MGYDNLKLEKGMYRQTGMSFTQVLESLDTPTLYNSLCARAICRLCDVLRLTWPSDCVVVSGRVWPVP